MSDLIIPIPKADVSVRDATPGDVPFLDSLQKMHREQVGFMHRGTLLGKIEKREILVAEDLMGERVGYCIGTDRYFKRDDVGIIYHLNVAPGSQRGFVGATLLKAMFDRAAYGCRLFCCWCAQDIEANKFWESMGFVPLAYRAGSRGRGKKNPAGRVHIFWQKRIREGDRETPWWFPTETNAGAMAEGRIVLPIPPDRRWSDEMPVMVRPEAAPVEKQIEDKSRAVKPKIQPKPTSIAATGGIRFGPAPVEAAPVVEKKKPREKKPKLKNDPKLVAAAREMKDRWLEHINTGGAALIESAGKYNVTRALPHRGSASPAQLVAPARLLPAA